MRDVNYLYRYYSTIRTSIFQILIIRKIEITQTFFDYPENWNHQGTFDYQENWNRPNNFWFFRKTEITRTFYLIIRKIEITWTIFDYRESWNNPNIFWLAGQLKSPLNFLIMKKIHISWTCFNSQEIEITRIFF